MKERGKRKDPLRFRQPPGEDSLQDNAGHQPDERKRLSNADQQFGAIVVFRRPRTRVLGAHHSRHSGARQPGSKEQPRIQPAKEKKSCSERYKQKRDQLALGQLLLFREELEKIDRGFVWHQSALETLGLRD